MSACLSISLDKFYESEEVVCKIQQMDSFWSVCSWAATDGRPAGSDRRAIIITKPAVEDTHGVQTEQGWLYTIWCLLTHLLIDFFIQSVYLFTYSFIYILQCIVLFILFILYLFISPFILLILFIYSLIYCHFYYSFMLWVLCFILFPYCFIHALYYFINLCIYFTYSFIHDLFILI